MIVVLVHVGCDSPDERLSRLARDATAEQASQNRAVTELNREAAASHQAVVEAVEESRRELASLERDLRQQRDRIDDERRELASERYWESLLVPIVSSIGAMLVAALPLVLCWYLLHGLGQTDESAVSDTLIREIVAEHPLLARRDQHRSLTHRDEMPSAKEHPDPPF